MTKKCQPVVIMIILIFIAFIFFGQKKFELSSRSIVQAETIEQRTKRRRGASNLASTVGANENQKISAQRLKKSTESPHPKNLSNNDAYCQILRANSGLTMTGKIQFSVLNYDADEEGNSGFVAFVRSSHCPENLFSKIKIDQFGRTKELIDCNSASREEILLNSGIQGNIDDHTADTKALSVAISGNGYFLIECASGLFLQRSGDFQRQGQELRYGKCHVLNRNSEPFAWSGKELNENGCDLEGACLAIVNPDPKTITSIDRTTFKMTGNNLPQIMTDGRVFLNALENFNDPQSGPTGPNWKEMPPFVPPAECNDVE